MKTLCSGSNNKRHHKKNGCKTKQANRKKRTNNSEKRKKTKERIKSEKKFSTQMFFIHKLLDFVHLSSALSRKYKSVGWFVSICKLLLCYVNAKMRRLHLLIIKMIAKLSLLHFFVSYSKEKNLS